VTQILLVFLSGPVQTGPTWPVATPLLLIDLH